MIIGKFHILLLHLPIGILFLALIMEWANYFNWQKIQQEVFTFAYGFGAASSIFACITGYVLSNGYDYATTDTDNHFWAGIVSAVITTFLFIISIKGHDYQKWISLLVAISLAVTGHLGGSLTHGEGFLFPPIGGEEDVLLASFEVDNIEEAEIYTDIVSPILAAKCVSCHGPNKIKGKLRMDSQEGLRVGGKSRKDLLGPESEIIARVELPISHDKHMPPKQKPQLSEKEIKLLEWWMDTGSAFEASVNSIEGYEEMVPIISDIIEESGDENSNLANIPAYLPETEPDAPNENAINILRNKQIVVLPAGENSPFLDINFVNVAEISSEIWEQINLISRNIVRLKLSDLEVTSQQMASIANMNNLVTLYLDNTGIGDGDLSNLSSLGHLSYLNISGTEVSNNGLSNLDQLANLKQLYAFRTKIEADSLATGAQIIKGGFTLEILESDTIRFPQ
jgi:uncharacterized membrane protein/mono/diheme cytochrome c family protein